MRILAGDYRAREFDQPKSALVRPMSQKARAAIFDVLGSIKGSTVLDLYAGSGAIGLEALSRAATQVVFIEKNAQVAAVIRCNIAKLGVAAQTQVFAGEAKIWLGRSKARVKYDVIVADPPYAELNPTILGRMADILAKDGVLVVSHSSKISSPELKSLQLITSKTYGDTSLSFYKMS